MKFFLDTADVKEIRQAQDQGLLDGVTTNPSLIAKEGRDFLDTIKEICHIVDGPVSAEVIATTAPEMIDEGKTYASIHRNVVVKAPMTPDGLKACRTLVAQGIRVNMTLCFSAAQALLAAKAGATYISPFIGRLDDTGQNGMDLIRDVRTIYDNFNFKTQILVASVRTPNHVVEAAKAGGDIATIPFKVFQQLVKHPLTDIGLERFLADWKQVQHKTQAQAKVAS